MEDHSPSFRVGENERDRVNQLRRFLIKVHLIGAARSVDHLMRWLSFAAVKMLRSMARLPFIGVAIDPMLHRADRHDRLHFELDELLRVCRELNDSGIPYWLAGGWGLDALIGSETRRHHDVDLVLYPYHDNLEKTAALFKHLGYVRRPPLGGTIWYPDAEVYEDSDNHHVEILNANWAILTEVREMLMPDIASPIAPRGEHGEIPEWLLNHCTSSGILDGLKIPTLSVSAQRIFHLGYPRRPEEPHAEDVIRLVDSKATPFTSANLSKLTSQRGSHEASTLLMIPVFSFPRELWRLCRTYHNDLLIPPHVTLAMPFMPLGDVTSEVMEQLTMFFSNTPAFDFELNEVKWYSKDVVYLQPSKVDAFCSIAEGLQETFPQPLSSIYRLERLTPHVTLSAHGSLADRRILARRAPDFTPIAASAGQVWLMSNARRRDDWAIIEIFQLGPMQKEQSVDFPKETR